MELVEFSVLPEPAPMELVEFSVLPEPAPMELVEFAVSPERTTAEVIDLSILPETSQVDCLELPETETAVPVSALPVAGSEAFVESPAESALTAVRTAPSIEEWRPPTVPTPQPSRPRLTPPARPIKPERAAPSGARRVLVGLFAVVLGALCVVAVRAFTRDDDSDIDTFVPTPTAVTQASISRDWRQCCNTGDRPTGGRCDHGAHAVCTGRGDRCARGTCDHGPRGHTDCVDSARLDATSEHPAFARHHRVQRSRQ